MGRIQQEEALLIERGKEGTREMVIFLHINSEQREEPPGWKLEIISC